MRLDSECESHLDFDYVCNNHVRNNLEWEVKQF